MGELKVLTQDSKKQAFLIHYADGRIGRVEAKSYILSDHYTYCFHDEDLKDVHRANVTGKPLSPKYQIPKKMVKDIAVEGSLVIVKDFPTVKKKSMSPKDKSVPTKKKISK